MRKRRVIIELFLYRCLLRRQEWTRAQFLVAVLFAALTILGASLCTAGIGDSARAWAAESGSEMNLPTPEELMALIDASEERIKTFEARINITSFKIINGAPEPEPSVRVQRTARMAGDRVYVRSVRTEYNRKVGDKVLDESVTDRAYVDSPKWSKWLCADPSHRPHAIIKAEPSGPATTPVTALYGDKNMYRGWVLQETATITRDDRGYYILKNTPREAPDTVLTFTVDPTRGYIPIESRVTHTDGRLLGAVKCSDLREITDGIWLPFRFTKELRSNGPPGPSGWGEGEFSRYVVDEMHVNTDILEHVNTDILEADVDIEFPEGTKVDNRISPRRSLWRRMLSTLTR